VRAFTPVLIPLLLAAWSPKALADEPSWATAQATELSRQAHDHLAKGEPEVALSRYLEAVKLDPTYGPAYLGLAAQYEARGDYKEAERTYAVGLEHVPGFGEALLARGRLRARLKRPEEAVADLEAAVSLDPDALPALKELAATYIAARALPAALAATRRLAAVALAQKDAAAANEAHLKARALAMLVGEADPVMAGKAGRGAVRSAIAAAAKRR
jgi:tetratricopeptide (TPR) repeat protein